MNYNVVVSCSMKCCIYAITTVSLFQFFQIGCITTFSSIQFREKDRVSESERETDTEPHPLFMLSVLDDMF